jgi:glycosyltransferase involved in cell wall biosynthesis
MTLWENARYLASVGHQVTFLSAGYPGAAHEETLQGIHVIRVGGIHWLWLRTFLFYAAKGRGRYDVVVAEGFGGSRVPRMAPLYVKEPIITEWHQIHRDLFAIQYPKLLNGPLNLLERLTARVHRNTLVRAGTDEWRQAFPSIGFKPENVFLLPVSIREDWISTSPSRLSVEPAILWLGKLRRYKCPDHAVRAMVDVVKRVPGARLILAIRRDDEKYERQLHNLVKDLELENHVEFRLNVSEQEKRDLLRSVRALIVTSAVEGFGIVVLEANACGVPVIASSGVPEGAVEEGVNGLRYPFGDIKALGDRIVELLSDNELNGRLSRNGLERVAAFSWSRIGAQFERIAIAAAIHRQPNHVAQN